RSSPLRSRRRVTSGTTQRARGANWRPSLFLPRNQERGRTMFVPTLIVLALVLGTVMASTHETFSLSISFVGWSGLKIQRFDEEMRIVLGWWVVSFFWPEVGQTIDDLFENRVEAYNNGWYDGIRYGYDCGYDDGYASGTNAERSRT